MNWESKINKTHHFDVIIAREANAHDYNQLQKLNDGEQMQLPLRTLSDVLRGWVVDLFGEHEQETIDERISYRLTKI